MASPKQQVQNNGGSNSDDDDNIFGKIFHFFMPKNGGGFDFFGMIFNVVIWGAVLFGLYNWVIKPHEEDIGKWLDGVNPALGNGFRTAMTGIDKALGGAGGGLTNVIGNMFPKWANDQAMNEQDDATFKQKYTKDMPPALADFITTNRQVLLPILANASGDPNKPIFLGAALKPENLPKTLPALLKNFPREKMQQLLVVMLQPGATPGASTKMTNDVIITLLTSKDPAMQDVRQQIPGLLQSIQGSVTDPAMHGLVQFLSNGNNIDALKNFADTVGADKFNNLITALTTMKDGKPDFNSDAMKAVQDAVKNDPAYKTALQTFAKHIDAQSLTDQSTKDFIDALGRDPDSAFLLAKAAMPTPAAATAAMPAAGKPMSNTGSPPSGGANAPAQQPMPASIDALLDTSPELLDAYSKQASLIGSKISRQARDTKDAAVKLIAMDDGHGNYPNLKVVLNFSKSMVQNIHGDANRAHLSHDVVDGLLAMIVPNPHAPKLNADELSAFFKEKANVDAFGQLLHDLDVHTLPKDKQALVIALKDNWNGGNGHSLVTILADHAGAQMFVGKGNSKGIDPKQKASLVSMNDIQISAIEAAPEVVYTHTPGATPMPESFRHNLAAVKALAAAMK